MQCSLSLRRYECALCNFKQQETKIQTTAASRSLAAELAGWTQVLTQTVAGNNKNNNNNTSSNNNNVNNNNNNNNDDNNHNNSLCSGMNPVLTQTVAGDEQLLVVVPQGGHQLQADLLEDAVLRIQ